MDISVPDLRSTSEKHIRNERIERKLEEITMNLGNQQKITEANRNSWEIIEIIDIPCP